ncbi:uncharacterized protein LOC143193794 isoform X2 [Rhynchophorus ferrugineus]|uniref:uncharacterized protein LOC143193794 isoform X2 n=1 Tax=Rhynchophorus ferrugineus TaxID=354439 RepID=UPI003FCC871D
MYPVVGYSNYGLRNLSEHARSVETGCQQLKREVIMAKWSNIRDSFLRSLRTKSGQSAKKKYIYSDYLQFLLKIAHKGDRESNFSQAATEDDSTEVEELTELEMPTAYLQYSYNSASPVHSDPSASRSSSNKHRPKSKRQLDDIEREILSELKIGKQSCAPCSGKHPRSDQEILLWSFLPFIRDMCEAELMDFQMEVLTIIKNIKQRRDSNPRPSSHQHTNVPLPSPAMSHSNSYQNSPPPSNQIEHQ